MYTGIAAAREYYANAPEELLYPAIAVVAGVLLYILYDRLPIRIQEPVSKLFDRTLNYAFVVFLVMMGIFLLYACIKWVAFDLILGG